MKCPSCGYKNIQGTDECESCHANLASLDGVVPKTPLEKVLMSDPIAKLPPREALTVAPERTVFEVVKMMNEAKVGSVLVTADGRLEGIVTERDIVCKVMSEGQNPSKVSVRSIMTPAPETLAPEDTLAYAVNRMSLRGYRHIPILRDRKITGIVSVRDVLKYLSKLFS